MYLCLTSVLPVPFGTRTLALPNKDLVREQFPCLVDRFCRWGGIPPPPSSDLSTQPYSDSCRYLNNVSVGVYFSPPTTV